MSSNPDRGSNLKLPDYKSGTLAHSHQRTLKPCLKAEVRSNPGRDSNLALYHTATSALRQRDTYSENAGAGSLPSSRRLQALSADWPTKPRRPSATWDELAARSYAATTLCSPDTGNNNTQSFLSPRLLTLTDSNPYPNPNVCVPILLCFLVQLSHLPYSFSR